MPADTEKNYYLGIKPKLMENLEKDETYYKRILPSYFPKQKIEQLLDEARFDFEQLLPQLPYIGGDANPLGGSFIAASWCLSFFRGLEKEGCSLYEIAKMSYEKIEHDIESKSSEKKRNVRAFYFSPQMRVVETERAKVSKSGKYPADWVSEFVEGDGKNFDFGIDFIECAICKFFKPRNAMKYVPIFCLSDYATYRAFGIGFKRTQKIVDGAPACDFRFKKEWVTPRGWPPEDLEEKFSFEKNKGK